MALKYELKYDDIVGVEHHFELFDDNYTGSPIEVYGRITLDYGQVKENLEAIRGQGLRVDLEADVNLTFEELFEENEKTFLCTYKRDSQILFRGWLNPEGFFEDYVNDKWQVSFDCIDGLGYLKELSFVDNNGFNIVGIKSQLEILSLALRRTGIQENINVAINIFYDTLADTESILENVFVECSRYVKDDGTTISSCEEVVKDILEPYGAVLVSNKGEWTIYKPNELFNDSTITFFKYDYLGASLGTETIDFDFTIGSQLDEFYPHHANANQRFTNIPSVGAYRINYKFGELRQYIINKNFFSQGGIVNNWTRLSSTLVVPSDGFGIVLEAEISGFAPAIISDPQQVEKGVFLKFNISGSNIPDGDGVDLDSTAELGTTKVRIYLEEIQEDGSIGTLYVYSPISGNPITYGWVTNTNERSIETIDYAGDFNDDYYYSASNAPQPLMTVPTPARGNVYAEILNPSINSNNTRISIYLDAFNVSSATDPRIDVTQGVKRGLESSWRNQVGSNRYNNIDFDIEPNNSTSYSITVKGEGFFNSTYFYKEYYSAQNVTGNLNINFNEEQLIATTNQPRSQNTFYTISIISNGISNSFEIKNFVIGRIVEPNGVSINYSFSDKLFNFENGYTKKIDSFTLEIDDRSNLKEKGTVSTFERTEKPSARTLPTKKVVTGDDTKNIFSGGLLKSDKKTITKEWYRKENVYQATTNYYVKPNTTQPSYGTVGFLYYFPNIDLTGATTISDQNGKTRTVISSNYYTDATIGNLFPPFVGVTFTGTRIESSNFLGENVIEDDLVSFIKTFNIPMQGEVNKPILEIMGSETMRMTAKTMRIFSGDVFGYFDYLSRVSIDQRAGKYGVTKYSYDTYNNVISMEIKQMYGTVLNDLSVDTEIETDNVVEPTIRG